MTVIKTIKKVICLVLAIGICLLAGYIGSMYSTPSIPTWYAGLQKPDLTPHHGSLHLCGLLFTFSWESRST
jgi:tryptophan-rich sensory protein